MFSSNDKMKKRITEANENDVFSISDFSDIVNQKTASKYLSRLSEENKLKKLFTGIFCKKNANPGIHDVAAAIARRNMWCCVPSGKTILYLLGLVKDKPEQWDYVTDGTYRQYKYLGNKIKFSRTTEKMFSDISAKSRMLVQVVKAYGTEKLTDEKLSKIRHAIGKIDLNQLKKDTEYMTEWISKVIKKMYNLDNGDISSNEPDNM